MKRHILTLFLLVFVLSASSMVAVSAAEEETTNTLPEAGNPLAMALLALLAIGIGGIKRRF